MTEIPPQWHGCVTDVDGDMFTADLRREGSPDLYADFSQAECGLSGIEAGDLIVVTPGSVRLLELPPWTREEIDEIMARAKVRAAQFAGYVK